VIFGDGEQSRDFTFVGDAVRANLRAAIAPRAAAGAAYNVGTGSTITVKELARRIGEAMGSAISPAHHAERAGDVRFSRADNTRARESLGWAPEISIEQGIALTRSAIGTRLAARAAVAGS
jgi:nucleoside-diphosphate-sugar epimerase